MVNTINPTECDRTTVYTGECRNFQDTEWIRFDSGRRRSPNAHDGNTWLIDVAYGSFWTDDKKVRNLVRMVEARPITRADLPSTIECHNRFWDHQGDAPASIDSVLHFVIDHINNSGGVGVDAREPLERALRERDGWKARADEWQASAEKCYEAWHKIAPARTVTREDVEKALDTGIRVTTDGGLIDQDTSIPSGECVRLAVDAVCDLLGIEAEPADPLLDKAQEFAALADWELTDREAELLHKVAAHVLGQEDRHE